MIKTVLASLTGYASDRTVLDSAVALARLDGAHIECLHTRIGALEATAMAQYAAPERNFDLEAVSRKIAQDQAQRLDHARKAFAEALARHALGKKDGTSPVTAEWREVQSLLNETLHEARYHDVTVMGRDPELSRERIESVLMQSGRPLLLAPPKPVGRLGRTVAIAWKASAESARALTAALPVLSRAERIVILSLPEDGEHAGSAAAEKLAAQLKRHGLTPQIQSEMSSLPVPQAIKEMAYSSDADLLVMGAYGHSRVREFIFGGATREILSDCAIPVLMCS